MKVAITGGSGFIGSTLISELLNRGHDVINLDINDSPLVQTIQCDVRNKTEVEKALQSVEAVYHLAGLVDGTARKNVVKSYELQILGTLNVLESCIQNDIGWFGLASTFLIYQAAVGNPPLNEDSVIDITKLHAFTGAKLASELLVRNFAEANQLKYAILRFGSVYGVGAASNVLGNFIDCLNANEPLVVWGHGKRRNQFTFVEDIAHGCIAALNGQSGTYNLVSPELTSVQEVTKIFEKEYAANTTFHYDKPERPEIEYISSDKAIDELAWIPSPLNEGISKTVSGNM